jgi:hypothetical protein
METGTYSYSTTNEDTGETQSGSGIGYPFVMQLMVAGDGYTYALYYARSSHTANGTGSEYLHLKVLRVSPAGNAPDISLACWDSACVQPRLYQTGV